MLEAVVLTYGALAVGLLVAWLAGTEGIILMLCAIVPALAFGGILGQALA